MVLELGWCADSLFIIPYRELGKGKTSFKETGWAVVPRLCSHWHENAKELTKSSFIFANTVCVEMMECGKNCSLIHELVKPFQVDSQTNEF